MALPGLLRLVLSAQLLSLLLIALGAGGAGAAEPLIVGGSTVSIADSPYQARVLIDQTLGTFQCGGSIRDTTHVVTAAHCVVDEDAGSYPRAVGPGAVTVGYSSASQSSLLSVGVSTVSVAPGYLRDGTLASDAAVLTLASPIDLAGDPEAEAIPFASDAELNAASGAPGTTALATGWGVTSEGAGTTPTLLRGVELRLQPDSLCEAAYGQDYKGSVMLCAGGDGNLPANNKGPCQGDSGGPLAIDVTPATPPSAVDRRLVGITSFSNGCGRPSTPAVYSRVQSPVLRPFLSAATLVGPPSAPATNPTITGTLKVGQTATCNAPQVPGSAPVQFLWYVVEGAGFSRAALTDVPTLQLPPELVGAFLVCDTRYENAGGFSYSDTPATDKVGPVLAALAPAPGGSGTTPRPPDTARPSVRVSSVRCLRGRCTIKVSASDTGGLVRSLSAKLTYKVKRCGTVAGRRRCRAVKKTKRLRPSKTTGGFTVTIRLKPGKYSFTAVATDTSGNRSRTARKGFRVKR